MQKYPNTLYSSRQELLQKAALQGQDYLRGLIAAGQLVTQEVFCELLDLDELNLEAGCQARRFFWAEIEGLRFFPMFYVSQATNRLEIEETSVVLGDFGWSQKWVFFTMPKGSLGGITPLEAISMGLFERVLITARGYRER